MYNTLRSANLFIPRDGEHEQGGSVLVVALGHPFLAQRIVVELPAAGSIADMLHVIGLAPDLPARVFLDDRIVVRDERNRVYPAPGQLLTVRAIPHGGGNAKDTELLTIAVAALAAVASWGVGAAISAEFATSAAVTGTTAAGATVTTYVTTVPAWASAVSAGVGAAVSSSINFLGGLAINALIPPPATPAVRLSSTPQSYTVSGGANFPAPRPTSHLP